MPRQEIYAHNKETNQVELIEVIDIGSLDEIKAEICKDLEKHMLRYLKKDDGYRLRKAATGQELPADVLERDQELRRLEKQEESNIKALKTKDEVRAYNWLIAFENSSILKK